MHMHELGEFHHETALTMSNLATNLGNQLKYEEAEELYARALAVLESQIVDKVVIDGEVIVRPQITITGRDVERDGVHGGNGGGGGGGDGDEDKDQDKDEDEVPSLKRSDSFVQKAFSKTGSARDVRSAPPNQPTTPRPPHHLATNANPRPLANACQRSPTHQPTTTHHPTRCSSALTAARTSRA